MAQMPKRQKLDGIARLGVIIPNPIMAPKAWSDHNIFIWQNCETITECSIANECKKRKEFENERARNRAISRS